MRNGYALFCLLTACSAGPLPCEARSECPDGQMCADGFCAHDESGEPCVPGSGPCSDDALCLNGRCAIRCVTSADCGDGFACSLPLGRCASVGAPCEVDGERCPGPDVFCRRNDCVSDGTTEVCTHHCTTACDDLVELCPSGWTCGGGWGGNVCER